MDMRTLTNRLGFSAPQSKGGIHSFQRELYHINCLTEGTGEQEQPTVVTSAAIANLTPQSNPPPQTAIAIFYNTVISFLPRGSLQLKKALKWWPAFHGLSLQILFLIKLFSQQGANFARQKISSILNDFVLKHINISAKIISQALYFFFFCLTSEYLSSINIFV